MSDVQSPNYLEALFSFLRVLATNVATALLPLFMVSNEDYPAGRALVIAFAVSALLTVINFFRPGETRFGPPPNPGAAEGVEDVEGPADAVDPDDSPHLANVGEEVEYELDGPEYVPDVDAPEVDMGLTDEPLDADHETDYEGKHVRPEDGRR